MIHVTNDWVLKALPNNDVATESTYTNNLSADLFPFLARLKSEYESVLSGEEKYITSSTDLDIPLYQPDHADVAWNSSDLARRMSNNIDKYCSPLTYISSNAGTGKAYGSWTLNLTEELRINPEGDNYGRETLQHFCRTTYDNNTGKYIYSPIEFEFFNPATCRYDKTLVLGAKIEYQRYYYVNGRRVSRYNPYRYNLCWYNKLNTSELYPLLSHMSQSHIKIMPDDDVQVTGTAITRKPNLYYYADVGFDPINETWVGLLNLFFRNIYTEYFTADDTPSTNNTYPFVKILGDDPSFGLIYPGPYASTEGGYETVLGTSNALHYIYHRAFKLKNQPTIPIEQRTDPLPKIGCYGPNTRISP